MALTYLNGAELQSATALMETDTVSGAVEISTTVLRSGLASWKFNTSGTAKYIQHVTSSGTADRYMSAYFLFKSFPASTTKIFQLYDAGVLAQCIQITSAGKLQFLDNTGTQQGADTAVLNTNQWYCLQLCGSDTPALQEARLDGVQIGTLATGYAGNGYRIGVDGAVTMEMYVDDIIVNDDTGSNETSWPDIRARVAHLHPNAGGDSNTWEKQDGSAGDSNNYNLCDETTPDDATTYVVRDTAVSNQPKDLYQIESPSNIGMEKNDIVVAIAVGARVGSTSATSAAGRNGNVGIKSGGTEAWSGSVDWSINGWTTNADPVPRVQKYVAYVDPSDSASWSFNKLEDLQIGARANSSATTDIRVTTVWLAVEYISRGNFFRMF